jgi:hypothetical protein
MDFKTLYNKTVDGIKYIMAQPTMMFRNRDGVEIIAYHTVLEDDIGRPDLIALKHYGDQSKTDMILKWNRISDPFSIMPGEILEIPAEYTPFYKLDRPTAFEDNKVKNEFVQGKKFSKKDLRRLEALKKKYNKETLLPPNVIPLGKKNYAFKKDGTVVLGAQAQNDEVVNSVLSDLASIAAADGQALRDQVAAAQNGEFDFTQGSGAGAGFNGANGAGANGAGANGTGGVGANGAGANGTGGAGANGTGGVGANGQGSTGSPSGSGASGVGGTGTFTETQLDKALNELSGSGGGSKPAGGNGQSPVGGGKADNFGSNVDTGDAPESTNGADGQANDGASCNK